MPDVFISYKSEEYDDALWVRRCLEQQGISCWMAPESIPGGSSYAEQIHAAITSCPVFVLMLSSRSSHSPWVRRELDIALSEDKAVLPFVLEQFEPDGDLIFYLKIIQCYNAYDGRGIALSHMLLRIKELLGFYDASGPDGQQPPRPSHDRENDAQAREHYQMLCPLAQQGDAQAQYELGQLYENGSGIYANSNEAIKWYQKAALQGHLDAQYRLGMCYLYGRHKSKGVEWLRKAAQKKHNDALYSLGMCYLDGTGVNTSHANAITCLARASALGHWRAQFRLAQLYERKYDTAYRSDLSKGLDWKQYLRKAMYWYGKAAQREDPEALYRLGRLWEKKRPDRAMDCYRKASEGKHALAQYAMARLLYRQAAPEQAILWLHQAAESDLPKAQHHLACCYRDGIGIEASQKQTVHWMKKAAMAGHTDAQYQTACYLLQEPSLLETRKNARNKKDSLELLRSAARKGHPDALFALAICYAMGKGTQRDRHKAIRLLRQNTEHLFASVFLAELLLDEKDAAAKAEALQLLEAAAKRHYVQAFIDLALLKEKQKRFDEAIYWYGMAAAAKAPNMKERFQLLQQEHRQCWQQAIGLQLKLKQAHSIPFIRYDTAFDIWFKM